MRRSAIILFPLCVAFVACGKLPSENSTAQGKATFEEYCIACHGPDGDVRKAANHDPAVPDLRTITKRYSGRFPRVVLREVIDGRRIVQAHGSRSMPVWGEVLTGDQNGDAADADVRVNALVDYLESIQTD